MASDAAVADVATAADEAALVEAHPAMPESPTAMESSKGGAADVAAADVAAADAAAADVAAEGMDEEETAGESLSAASLMRRIARLAGDECVP